MHRFLIAAHPAPGHVNPMYVVAVALQEQGHEVFFYSSSTFAEQITQAGLSFCAPITWEGIGTQPSMKQMAALKRRADMTGIIMRQAMFGSVVAMTEDLEHYIRAHEIEVVVYDLLMPGAKFAAERLGIISASVVITPIPVYDGYKAWLPQQVWRAFDVQPTRQQLHLPPQSGNLLHQPSPFLHLVPATSSFLEAEAAQAPDHFRFVGPLLPSPPGNVPDWINALSDLPAPILVTTSSNKGVSFVRTKADLTRYIQCVMDGLAQEPVTLIITLPSWYEPDEELPSVPDNVRLEAYVPHMALLPYLRAVVTHGGWGIMGQALAYGLPLVVVPFFWDQFANATRCQQQGVGLTIDLKEITADKVRTAVSTILDKPSYRQKAQAEAAVIRQLNPIKRIVTSLEMAMGPQGMAMGPQEVAMGPQEMAMGPQEVALGSQFIGE